MTSANPAALRTSYFMEELGFAQLPLVHEARKTAVRKSEFSAIITTNE